jgi:hypothetical protein
MGEGGGRGFKPHGPQLYFYTSTIPPIRGCHVAAHDWATWYLYNELEFATCPLQSLPCILYSHQCTLPCHLLHSQHADVMLTSALTF